MSRTDRKRQIDELCGWVSTQHKPPNYALREHLMSKIDEDVDLEAEAKAFLAPAKPKQAAKKPAKKKVAKKKVVKKVGGEEIKEQTVSEFFDYSPHNGMIYHTAEGDTEDDLILRSSQDVEPILDAIKVKRNIDDNSGIKQGWWHYCAIPTTVELELRQKGINIYNKNQTKELLKEINTNYPHLKVTRLNHAL